MSEDLKRILEEIESLRKNLGNVMKDRDTTDPQVVAASQMLDAVLNEYYRVIMKMEEKREKDS
ncbi:MAG: Spo0E family sporulation regulatory protein-aspartic acid phosphatase [Acidobacteriota bacterium]